jgi:hypothetical protein
MWITLCLWLLAVLLAAPGANFLLFNGLPFSTSVEYLAACLILPLLVVRSLRRLIRRRISNAPRGVAIVAVAVLAGALAIKAGLFWSQRYEGFVACYASPAASSSSAGCERSFENPWNLFSTTRIDPTIDFGPDDWHLSFVNSLRFNYYPWTRGIPSRERLPFSATWFGTVEVHEQTTLLVDYVGEGSVQAGRERLTLAPDYERSARQAIVLRAGRTPVAVSYRFDDGFRVGQRVRGPYATLRLRTTAAIDGTERPLAGASGVGRLLGMAADAVIGLGLALLALFYLTIFARDRWVLAGAVAVSLVIAWVPSGSGQHNWARVAGLLALVGLFAHRGHRGRLRLLLAFGAVVGWFWIEGVARGELGRVLVRAGGSDWLTYESYARSILESWSLRAGEDVFYFQPLFRYVRFLERLVFGDGEGLVVAWEMATLNVGLLWMFWSFGVKRASPRWRGLVASAAAVLLVLLANSRNDVEELVANGASESCTWIAFPVLVAALFGPSRRRLHRLGLALAGLSLTCRINQAPALLWMVVVFLAWYQRPAGWRHVTAAAALFLAIVLWPLAHNAHYGGQWVLGATSATIPDNLIVQPAQLLHPGAVLPAIRAQSEGVFYYGRGRDYFGGGRLTLVLRGLQLMWIVAIAWTLAAPGVARGRLLSLLSVPLLYLGVHLVYQVTPYYPRHIIIGHMAMGVMAFLALTSGRTRESQKHRQPLRRGG